MTLPIQSMMNMDKPEEHALWALVALPGPANTAPMLLPPDSMRAWSKRLWECGFRHHPELQEIKYVPPIEGAEWTLGTAGKWVGIDEIIPPELSAPSTAHLSLAEKQVLLQRLQAEFATLPAQDEEDGAVVNE